MKINIIDFLLITIFVSTAGYSTFKLMNPKQNFVGSGEVASIVESTGELLAMTKRELAWKFINNGQNLGLGDKILTNENSTAEVQFSDGLRIKVEPSTLILIDRSNIEIKKGKVKVLAVRKKTSQQSNNQDKKQENPSMEFKINGSSVGTAVHSGPIEISAEKIADVAEPAIDILEGDSEEVIFIESIKCSDKMVEAPSFELDERELKVSAIANITSIMYYDHEKNLIRQVPAYKNTVISHSDLKKIGFIAFQKNLDGCQYYTNQVPVTVDWDKILNKNINIGISLKWSATDLVFELSSKKEDNEYSERKYKLTFLSDTGNTIEEKENLQVGKIVVYENKLPPAKARLEDYWGDIDRELVIALPTLPAPLLHGLENHVDLNLINLQKKYQGFIEYKLEISWDGHPASKGYTFNIMKDSDLSKKIYSKNSNVPQIDWPIGYDPGVYRYQVIAIDKFGRPGEPSSAGKIIVE